MSEREYLFTKDQNKKYNSINSTFTIIMTTAKEVIHNEYHIHWRLHIFWTLAVVCFIIGKLWWLVPLPGPEVLPPYRTYPANFLDTIFLTIGCALATRSIVVGLVKSFAEGIYPDSIVAFGSTGGFAAMWSCIKHRSGLRYFLIAMLVTACTLLGSALAGELQSSVRIYYWDNGSTSSNLAQCQHSTPTDYNLASSAYASGLISNTISDAQALLNSLNASQPMKSYSVSLIQSILSPIPNVTLQTTQGNGSPPSLSKRHYRRPSSTTSMAALPTEKPCSEEEESAGDDSASISGDEGTRDNSATNNEIGVTTDKDCSKNDNSTINVTTNNNNSNSTILNNNNNMNTANDTSTNVATASPLSSGHENNSTLIISSAAFASENTEFNSSKLTIVKNVSSNNTTVATFSPYLVGSNEIPIKLGAFRYTTPEGKHAVIIYSSPSEGFIAGVYVSAEATNYTCQSRAGSISCDEGTRYTANGQVVADAMVAAIQSGQGLYGTNSANSLTVDIANGNGYSSGSSKLVDALFANPLCGSSSPDLMPIQGTALYPYSAGRLTPLAIIWLCLFAILWLIGVYLIGYSEHTWTKLAVTGSLVPQIISKSPNMFADGELGAKTVNIEMFLDQEEGKMNFDKVHRHGYTVTIAEFES